MLNDMKVEKLMVQFVEKYVENPAFHDTFTDQDMLEALWKEKNMREIIAGLFSFTLHSAFSKKPVAKKEGTARKR